MDRSGPIKPIASRPLELGQDGKPEYLSTTHREYPWPGAGGRQESIDSRGRQAQTSVRLGHDHMNYLSTTHASYGAPKEDGRQAAIDSRKIQANCSVILGHDGPPDFSATTYKLGFPVRPLSLDRPDNQAISNELNRTKFVLGTDPDLYQTTYRSGFKGGELSEAEKKVAGRASRTTSQTMGAPMPSTVVLGTNTEVLHREDTTAFMPHLGEYKKSSPARALTGMAVPPPPGHAVPIDAFVPGYDATEYVTSNMAINRYCKLVEAYTPVLTTRFIKEHPALDLQRTQLAAKAEASLGGTR